MVSIVIDKQFVVDVEFASIVGYQNDSVEAIGFDGCISYESDRKVFISAHCQGSDIEGFGDSPSNRL